MKKTREKGITLIALVITIIVMMILVAVTVAFAMSDNGVIENSRNAKKQTAVKADRESLQDYMLGKEVYNAITGDIDLSKLDENLQTAGWDAGEMIGDDELKVSGKQSGEIFIITNKGKIILGNNGLPGDGNGGLPGGGNDEIPGDGTISDDNEIKENVTYYAWNANNTSMEVLENKVMINIEGQVFECPYSNDTKIIKNPEMDNIDWTTLYVETIGEEKFVVLETDVNNFIYYFSTKQNVPNEYTQLSGVFTNPSNSTIRFNVNNIEGTCSRGILNFRYFIIGDTIIFGDRKKNDTEHNEMTLSGNTLIFNGEEYIKQN